MEEVKIVVLGQDLTSLDKVKGYILAKRNIFYICSHIAEKLCVAETPSPAYSSFNSNKMEYYYDILFQYLGYVGLGLLYSNITLADIDRHT